MPALSVVLPVRDVAPYLPDTLASLDLNVVDVELQVIVVDDGSSDATPEVVAEWARTRPWVDVLHNDVAVGLADARNQALDRATGRYVTFLDGDDWLARGYLTQLVRVAERLGCDFVRTDHVQVTGRERVVHHAPEWRREVVLDPASGILPAQRRTMVDYPYAWAGIYRRELGELLRFPAGLRTAEDRPWIWRLHRAASSYAVTSLAGLFYRREVPGSLTRIGDARQLDFLDAYSLVLAEADADGDEAGTGAHLAKAVRQFLAVLSGHLAQAGERFTPELQAELHERARGVLAAVDPAVLARMLPVDARSSVLQPLLPTAVVTV